MHTKRNDVGKNATTTTQRNIQKFTEICKQYTRVNGYANCKLHSYHAIVGIEVFLVFEHSANLTIPTAECNEIALYTSSVLCFASFQIVVNILKSSKVHGVNPIKPGICKNQMEFSIYLSGKIIEKKVFHIMRVHKRMCV